MTSATITSTAPADHGASADTTTYTPPDPKGQATRQLEEGQRLLEQALEALRASQGQANAAELVGKASDRIGSALYHLRQITRR